MPNGEGRSEPANNSQNWLGRWIVGGGSVLAVVVTFSITTAKDASIALDVARQHGDEILILNQDLHRMQTDLYDRTKDRYTSKDAERDVGYLRRDLDTCMAWRMQHQRDHEQKYKQGPL
jgi:hypothetical protein